MSDEEKKSLVIFAPDLFVPAKALEEEEVPVPEVLHAAKEAGSRCGRNDPDWAGEIDPGSRTIRTSIQTMAKGPFTSLITEADFALTLHAPEFFKWYLHRR